MFLFLNILFFSLKELFKIYVYFTAAGVVPRGGRKMSPRSSTKVQNDILFQSFEIREYILNNQKILIGSDSCSRSSFIIWVPFDTLNLLPY